jgi:hypothetical protein
MFFGEVRTKELVPCLLCSKRYSVQDVQEGRYFASTGVCMSCYEEMAKKPISASCFGKKTVGQQFGYNSRAIVCAKICPDREVCKQFVSVDV